MAILAKTRCRRAGLRLPILSSLLWLAALCLASPAESPAAPVSEVAEYQIKAVFLFNFAQFVDWPVTAFPDGDSPLVIGILGADPFGQYLDVAVKGEKVNNRSIVVRRYSRAEDAVGCHILFISRSESVHLGKILEQLRDRSILTVGDVDGFNQQGGIIRFAMENSKVRLKINLRAAKEAHLTISSKLLRPAEIVSMRRDSP
jgi:hypothetical protein